MHPAARTAPRSALVAFFLAACGSGGAPTDATVTDGSDAVSASDVVSANDADDADDANDANDVAATDAADVADARPPCTVADGGAYPAAPAEPQLGAVVRDLHFTRADGSPISLSDYYAPCAERPRLLVVRVMAAWAGTARWHAAHTALLRDHPNAARLTVLDLLVLGQDDLPAVAADVPAWRARYDVQPDELALDPDYQLRDYYFGDNRLPLYVLIDTSTMVAMQSLGAPESDVLPWEISNALARMDGTAPPPRPPRELYDNRLSPDQWEMLRAMAAPGAPPPEPSNARADDPAAADLGRALFSDPGLSRSGSFSCAFCHRPERAFTDGLPTGMAAATGGRNTPTVVYAAHAPWQFWDGRADSLWAQALGPTENPVEMDSSRLLIAHYVLSQYGTQYGAVFGPPPDLSDPARFPAEGKPGDPAWEAMTPADHETVTRVFVNVGKALEAFERTLTLPPTPLDAYIAGDTNALSVRARDGLHHWFRFGCAQCHYGPRLTDDSFHNIQMPTGHEDGSPDNGRVDAIALLAATPFADDGTFSDAPADPSHLAGLAPQPMMLGQFRTPALRGAAATGPWGHGGTFSTLESVALHYSNSTQRVNQLGAVGTEDAHLVGFHQDATTLGALADVIRAATPASP